MKSSIRKRTYQAIYRLLNRVSPLNYDCGTLCDAACCTCTSDETEDSPALGIYLLPGEEKVFTKDESWLHWTYEQAEDFDFPESWHGKIYFINCLTPPHCLRERRPLQCRFFPLAPHITPDGVLHLILCPSKLPYTCPLIEKAIPLNPSFIQATYTVWSHLIRDSRIFDLVQMDSEDREEDGLKLHFLR